ncbi:glycosyltransferase [Flavipsychrobacter stenotrophus]|nr:glycosyltransferase [Flavipsychrobacter stenotrophus]
MVKYTEIINALPFLFDMDKLQEKYHLVIEPSAESPYQMYSAFLPLKSEIFVQSLSIREKNIHIAHGFKPVPLTAGDWVNIENFYPDESIEKKYDFCIISNFIPVKRYPFLLAALSKYWIGDLRFAIAASSHVGYKREWMEALLKKYGLFDKADIFIEIKQTQINEILNASYCHVLASRREGANKANFESMMAGTPVVVVKDHIGFPNWKFTSPLVTNYTTPQDLVSAIKKSRATTRTEVAKAASEMIGYKHASNTLNKEIKKVSLARGDEWTVDILPKINRVHLFYGNQEDTHKCIKDYQFIESIVYEKSYYQAALAIERFSKNESI